MGYRIPHGSRTKTIHIRNLIRTIKGKQEGFSPTAVLIGVLIGRIVSRHVVSLLAAGSKKGSARVPRVKKAFSLQVYH